MDVPKFKYHLDPIKTEVFKTGKTVVCDCCGKKTDVYYDGIVLSEEDVEYLCPECIKSGKAHEKFDCEFVGGLVGNRESRSP